LRAVCVRPRFLLVLGRPSDRLRRSCPLALRGRGVAPGVVAVRLGRALQSTAPTSARYDRAAAARGAMHETSQSSESVRSRGGGVAAAVSLSAGGRSGRGRGVRAAAAAEREGRAACTYDRSAASACRPAAGLPASESRVPRATATAWPRRSAPQPPTSRQRAGPALHVPALPPTRTCRRARREAHEPSGSSPKSMRDARTTR
jgi:hypothetical protein